MLVNGHLLIAGGGLAAHAAAFSARANGYDGRITIVSDEPNRPYDRTPLSKQVMQGKRSLDELHFQPVDDYIDKQISLLTDTAIDAIDFASRRAKLSPGETLAWDQLLIATGARPVRLGLPGFDLDGVHYLRTIADAGAIRRDLERASEILVIGAGFIGSEVAASARVLGKSVTLVDLASAPMIGALGEEVAGICHDIHADHGVDLRMGREVIELRGSDRVEQAIFSDGQQTFCDMVVVGVGVRPCVELFNDSDIETSNGILVDEFCRTSIPDVFAAGDVANWWHPGLEARFRVEHFDNAGAQGTVAGKVIAGVTDEPFAPVPYFWSDQYDTNIQFAGYPVQFDQVVLRGSRARRTITGFYLRDGVIRAGVTINQPRDLRSVRRLVEAGAVIDPDTLRNPDTDLRKLSREY